MAIDALGGRKFRAHVDSVQAGSGAAFSLLPPENATGNFVKVVQRVPVKILFDEPLPADHMIGPGLSVTPSVQTSSFTVPDFVTAIRRNHSGHRGGNWFPIHFEPADKRRRQIIFPCPTALPNRNGIRATIRGSSR